MRRAKVQAKVGSTKCFPADFFKKFKNESVENGAYLDTHPETEEGLEKSNDFKIQISSDEGFQR